MITTLKQRALLAFGLMALNTAVNAQTPGWQQRTGLLTGASSPALVAYDNSLYVAAAGQLPAPVRIGSTGGLGGTGSLQTTSTSVFLATYTSGNIWNSWRQVATAPVQFHPAIRPVFALDGGTIHLFAAGKDRNIYHSYKTTSATNWSAWQALTSGGPLETDSTTSIAWKRFHAVLTRNSGAGLEIHVLYKAPSQMAYSRFSETGSLLASETVSGDDGAIGTNGAAEVWLAVRKSPALVVYRKTRTSYWPSFQMVGERAGANTSLPVYDVSNLVFFDNAFHLAYTVLTVPNTSTYPAIPYVYSVQHARFRITALDDGYTRPIAKSILIGTLPQAELCVYRNKLVAAYNDYNGAIRYARLDTANPLTPWIGDMAINNGLSSAVSGRPSLAAFNTTSIGNDLFAAATTGSVSAGSGTVSLVNFSREIFRITVGRQFAIYTSNSDSLNPVCGYVAPTLESMASENRPVLTEIGYGLWSLPDWLSGTVFQTWGRQICWKGQDAIQKLAGWYNPPCGDATRYPVVVMGLERPFLCNGSIWIGQTNDYRRVFEELGHELASALGFSDQGRTTPAISGISSTALADGYKIFSERVGTCSGSTRCRGFTGIAGNYDAGSLQHSFLYIIYYYFSDGDTIRTMVSDDLAAKDDLLQRKYNWVKQNIFRGVEFKSGNALLTVL